MFLYFGYKPPRCRPAPHPPTPHLGLISMWFVVSTTLLSFLFTNLNPSTYDPPPPLPPLKPLRRCIKSRAYQAEVYVGNQLCLASHLRPTHQVIVPKSAHSANSMQNTQTILKFSSGEGYSETCFQEIPTRMVSNCAKSLAARPKQVFGNRQAPAFCDL